jgi:hypothetical protein
MRPNGRAQAADGRIRTGKAHRTAPVAVFSHRFRANAQKRANGDTEDLINPAHAAC